MKATITSAVALSKEQLKTLVSGLEKKYGSLEVETKVDPSVIGGVKVRVGSTTFDATVAHKLKSLSATLDEKLDA